MKQKNSIEMQELIGHNNKKYAEKAITYCKELLMNEEEIKVIGVQKHPLFNFSPDSLVLTNKRVLVVKPSFFGLKMSFADFLWTDVKDFHIKEELFGGVFMFKLMTGRTVHLDYIPKKQNRMLYSYAQEIEAEIEAMRKQIAIERDEKILDKTRFVNHV
jgi:hypothetical protein